VVTSEQRDQILQDARDTLDRLREAEQWERAEKLPSGHFDPWKAAQMRKSAEPEPEVRHSDPVFTMPPAPAIVEPSEDYRDELLAHVIAELQNEFDDKLAVLRAEVRELRAAAIGNIHEQLTRTVAKCDELVARLERREPMSGNVVDLPPWPRRTGRDVN
jgi:hypothetical protein